MSVLSTFADPLSRSASASTVYGEAVWVGEKAVIPVARVAFGFGGGAGLDYERDEEQEGAGGGGGMRATPVGVVEVSPEGTRFIPIERRWGLFLVGLAVVIYLGTRR